MGQEGREESFREFIVSCIRYNATMFRNRNGYNVVFMCIFVDSFVRQLLSNS